MPAAHLTATIGKQDPTFPSTHVLESKTNHVKQQKRHCASGVPEPTTPPTPQQLASHSAAEAATKSAAAATTTATMTTTTTSASHSDSDDHDHNHDVNATATTCEPHGDHWHCPAGVAEPTTAPAAPSSNAVSGTASVTRSDATASLASSSAVVAQQTGNAAAAMGGASKVVALLGVAAWVL